MESSTTLNVSSGTSTGPGKPDVKRTPMARACRPDGGPRSGAAEPVQCGYADMRQRRPLLSMLRLLLRSQLLRHAERRELTSDEQLLRRLRPFLQPLDMDTLHSGLEWLTEEDACARRPYIAALACDRQGERPWVSVLEANYRMATEVRHDLTLSPREEEWSRLVDQVYRFYGRN